MKTLCAALLLLLFCFHSANNYIWLSRDGNFQLGCDVVHHLIKTVDFYDGLLPVFQRDMPALEQLNVFTALFRYDGHWWPKLTHFAASVFYLIFGVSNITARMSNMLFFLILIIFIYRIGKEMGGCLAGVLAACFVSFYPGIFGMSRSFGIDFPLVAMVTLNMFYFIKCDNFNNRKYSIISGIASGLGVLTKGPFDFFIAGPLAYMLFKIFFTKRDRARILFCCVNFIIYLLLTVLISFVWLAGALNIFFAQVFHQGWLPAACDYLYFYGGAYLSKDVLNGLGSAYHRPFSSIWLFYYFMQMLSHIGFLFVSIFLISLPVFLKSEMKESKKLILLWIAAPYIIFTVISAKWGRYYFPAFPAIALVSAFGISRIRPQIFKNLSVLFLIIAGLFQFYRTSFLFMHRFPDNVISYWPRTSGVYMPLDHGYAAAPIVNNNVKICKDLANIIARDGANKNDRLTRILITTNKNKYSDNDYSLGYLLRTHLCNLSVAYGAEYDNIDYDKRDFDYIVMSQDSYSEQPDYEHQNIFFHNIGDILVQRQAEEIKKSFIKKYSLLMKSEIIPGISYVYLSKKSG